MKKILALGVLALGLSACGGSTPPAAPTINLSGKWVVDLAPYDNSGNSRARLTLTQNGGTVVGDVEAATYVGTYTDIYEAFGKLSGTVSGDTYTLNIVPQGKYSGSLTLNGTVIAGKLSGTFSAVGANGSTKSGSFASAVNR